MKNKNIYKGGKVLGQGSSGCVVTPAISCDEDSIIGKVSKIGYSSQIKEEELIIGEKLKEIDTDNQFLLYAEKICDIVPKKKNVKRRLYTM